MHFINWYTAMCFNRILKRKGHFWEQRYYSTGFHKDDKQRALNTLRYIHANPKSAEMRKGFFYTFSNYGTYDQLTDDGLTQWHPAFFSMGNSLDECADRYQIASFLATSTFVFDIRHPKRHHANITGAIGF